MLVSLGLLLAGAHAKRPGAWVSGAASALLVGTILMLLTRDFIRQQALDAAGFAAPARVAPQLIAVFLVLLVVTLGTVAWMAWLLAVAPARAAERAHHASAVGQP